MTQQPERGQNVAVDRPGQDQQLGHEVLQNAYRTVYRAIPQRSFDGCRRRYHSLMAWSLRSVIPVWVLALLGAVAVGAFAPSRSLTWIPIVLAASVLLTMAIQLALQRKEGLVTRMMASLGGALVICAVATGILAIV